MDVLTNIPGKPGRFWGDHTHLVGPVRPGPALTRFLGKKWATRLVNLASAVQLFRRRRHCQGIVTGGGLDGLFLALLQALFPWGRTPHVLVDCNWYQAQTAPGRWLRSAEIRLAATSVQHFVVWASHEIEDYARTFSVPEEKFRYVPFHDTLDGYDFEIRDDGYLFAGGNYDRDYPTLIEAVRPLDAPVWIATTRTDQLGGVILPSHVSIRGTSEAGFRQAMAAARLVVVPMQKRLLHSGGQQTCLNAMRMGKPSIAVGKRWAEDLMSDGETGLIVDYQDVAGLRRAIAWVLDHPEKARQMALRGQAHARQFTTRRCMETVYRLVVGEPLPDHAKPQAANSGAICSGS